MKDYYLEGEERFGPVTSRLYHMAAVLPLMKRFYGFVLDDMSESGAKEVLDVGTGPGDIPLGLAERCKSMHICAVDPSRSMVKIASGRGRRSGSRVEFRMGSSRHVPFGRKFDVILLSITYHHWEDKEASLRYLKRFLKKGGEIRIYEHDAARLHGILWKLPAVHSIRVEQVKGEAESAGLEVSGIRRRGSLVRLTLKRV